LAGEFISNCYFLLFLTRLFTDCLRYRQLLRRNLESRILLLHRVHFLSFAVSFHFILFFEAKDKLLHVCCGTADHYAAVGLCLMHVVLFRH